MRNRLVKMQAIAMFASVRDVGRYTDDELRRLSLLRVGGLTIGMESADDRALEIGGKGYTSADVREQCLRLEAAGMEYSLIYMTGLAGAGRGVDAAKNSLEVINLLRPRFIGVGSLTPFEGTRLHESAREEEFEPPRDGAHRRARRAHKGGQVSHVPGRKICVERDPRRQDAPLRPRAHARPSRARPRERGRGDDAGLPEGHHRPLGPFPMGRGPAD